MEMVGESLAGTVIRVLTLNAANCCGDELVNSNRKRWVLEDYMCNPILAIVGDSWYVHQMHAETIKVLT